MNTRLADARGRPPKGLGGAKEPILRAIHEAHIASGMTVGEFEKALGLHQSRLAQIANYGISPRVCLVAKMADVLGYKLALVPKEAD